MIMKIVGLNLSLILETNGLLIVYLVSNCAGRPTNKQTKAALYLFGRGIEI